LATFALETTMFLSNPNEMKNSKSLQAPQIGLYQVLNAYFEVHNGKRTPVAEVFYKAHHWTKLDPMPRRIRLRSLTNPSSIGPKNEFSVTNLRYKILKVSNKFERPHPEKVGKLQYGLEWDIIEPVNYNETLQEESEIEMDFTLQEENFAINEQELHIILDGMEADEYLSTEYESFNLPIQIITTEEDL
jgi:hypothetical protein